MDSSAAGQAARRSRRLNILAVVVLILGASTPIRWTSASFVTRPILEPLRMHTGFTQVVNRSFQLALGALGAWAGWALLRRRSSAPLVSCVAGGAIAVDSGVWLYSLALPSSVFLGRAFDSPHSRMALSMLL